MGNHRAGFVSIIGRPNAGKSTLLNALTGEPLSIIHPKAGMTRHRIRGILNGPEFQMVFSDTPGVIDPAYKLHEGMVSAIKESVEDADVLVVLIDAGEKAPHPTLLALCKEASCYTLLVLNKLDTIDQKTAEMKLQSFREQTGANDAIAISALHGFNPASFVKLVVPHLPEHEAFFPKDQLTDRHLRFFVSEIVRGKIFDLYSDEIPYSAEVLIDEYKESKKLTKIYGTIVVEKQSQKGIIIGPGGKGIKTIGTRARIDIEEFIGSKVYLELHVKVIPNWRKDAGKLRRFGYTD